jgi:hypothetical protein
MDALLVRILDRLDFLIYDFSVIYYGIVKFKLIYLKKRDIIEDGLRGGFRKKC